MLEDIRSHDPAPTREELEWISADPIVVLFRVAALAVIALAIGLSAVDRGAPPQPTSIPNAATANAQEPRS